MSPAVSYQIKVIKHKQADFEIGCSNTDYYSPSATFRPTFGFFVPQKITGFAQIPEQKVLETSYELICGFFKKVKH